MALDEFRGLEKEWLNGVEHDFPEEKMGSGDKLILRRVVRERATYLRVSVASAYFILDVRLEMEKYGYKTRKMDCA